MKIFGPLIVFMVFFGLSAEAQIHKKIISNDSIVLLDNMVKKVGKNVNFTIVPGPAYGVSQKLGLVVLPMIFYNLKRSDTLSPPSSTALLGYFDFYGSWMVAVKQSLYWNDNKWRAFVSGGYGELKLKYFGVGRDTSIVNNDESNYMWVRMSFSDENLTCYRKIYKGLYGGLEYRYSYSNLAGSDSAATAKLTSDSIALGKVTESVFAPLFIWDSRDYIYWTKKGYYAGLNFQFANNIILSSQNYGILTGWVNGYHQINLMKRPCVLSWHLYFQSGWGEMPYFRYASYGQGDDVTGYTRGKYVNKSETTAQVELKSVVWKFIAAGVYGGTGKVFPSMDVFGQSVWLHYGGVRLYANILPVRDIWLRLDMAFARSDWGFYVGVGQAF